MVDRGGGEREKQRETERNRETERKGRERDGKKERKKKKKQDSFEKSGKSGKKSLKVTKFAPIISCRCITKASSTAFAKCTRTKACYRIGKGSCRQFWPKHRNVPPNSCASSNTSSCSCSAVIKRRHWSVEHLIDSFLNLLVSFSVKLKNERHLPLYPWPLDVFLGRLRRWRYGGNHRQSIRSGEGVTAGQSWQVRSKLLIFSPYLLSKIDEIEQKFSQSQNFYIELINSLPFS